MCCVVQYYLNKDWLTLYGSRYTANPTLEYKGIILLPLIEKYALLRIVVLPSFPYKWFVIFFSSGFFFVSYALLYSVYAILTVVLSLISSGLLIGVELWGICPSWLTEVHVSTLWLTSIFLWIFLLRKDSIL